ncbi:MAG: DUF692 domain-containing protein [Gammaproteobacteria bacterium]|nr:DUF692 domain-containing protein [Gammaproteobacteria bacterium]
MSVHTLGFGLGARVEHYDDLLATTSEVEWLEILSENYLVPGGKPRHYLTRLREQFPMVMHGVSLSIGSTDPLNTNYLCALRDLAQNVEPEWISDHLCWTGVEGINLHDLMPLPYTEEALTHVVARVKQVQDYLQRPILLENVSSYIDYRCSQMSEWEFLNAVAEQADCFILLDVNNVYVSSRNHGFDPARYIEAINPQRVKQLHIAGHDDQGDLIVDTHDASVANAVWSLLKLTYQHCGMVATMIERDANVPPLATLLSELGTAREIAHQVCR